MSLPESHAAFVPDSGDCCGWFQDCECVENATVDPLDDPAWIKQGEPSPSGYGTIVADPPWNVTRPTGWGRRDKNHQPLTYPTLSVSEIAALNVEKFAASTSYLFLWTVNKYIPASYYIAEAWGFRPVTLLTWIKKPIGMGPGGHFASTTEHILYARRGNAGAEFGRKRLYPSTWFDWPKGAHSVKPEEFQDLVEQHFPAPRLEMFARRRRAGWDVWGNEVDSDVELIVRG